MLILLRGYDWNMENIDVEANKMNCIQITIAKSIFPALRKQHPSSSPKIQPGTSFSKVVY
jgi:hypothetical protein